MKILIGPDWIRLIGLCLILGLIVTLATGGCLDFSKEEKDEEFSGSSIYNPPPVPIAIPSATITLDGLITDWTVNTAEASDPQGDASLSYTGDDIKGLSLAKDATNLYIRMDLWDNVNTGFWNYPPPNNGCYRLMIESNGSFPSFEVGIAYNNSASRWEMGYNGANAVGGPTGLQGASFVGVQNNVIEVKIPLSTIGNPSKFYYITGGVVMIGASAAGPETTIDECEVRPQVTMQGNIYVSGTTTPIAGAVVSTSLDSQTATTDANGYFSLTTATQPNYSMTPYTLTITATGYQPFSQTDTWGDYPLNQKFYLTPNP